MDLLRWHIALGQKEGLSTVGMNRYIHHQHGVARASAVDEDIARFDRSVAASLEFTFQGKGTRVREYFVQVSKKLVVAAVR